ncbi:MAG: VOC family protein [Candidatus Binataceae bacterium]
MTVELIGIDHVYLTVSNFARSERFYDRVMRALDFKKGTTAFGGDQHAHYYNRSFQVTIRPARGVLRRHNAYSPGLHHLCFRATDEGAVNRAARTLKSLGVKVEGPRACPEYAPDYYAVFFSDPDGLRLEIVNHLGRRKVVSNRWRELFGFVNPLSRLLARDASARRRVKSDKRRSYSRAATRTLRRQS